MRPSAFTNGIPYEEKQKDDLKEDYRRDIELACKGIDRQVPPRPLERTSVRVLQWNINKLKGIDRPSDANGHVYPYPEVHDVVLKILSFDADILVLQECGDYRDEIFDIQECDEHIGKLGRLLFQSGYRFLSAGVHCPTVLATRLPYISLEALPLDQGFRGAGCFCAAYAELKCSDNTPLIVYGAHLNHKNNGPFHAGQSCRLDEIKELLRHYHMRVDPHSCALIVADFNQQRRRDYLPEEWDRIVAKKLAEEESVNDGVEVHLMAAGFLCCLDHRAAHRNWQGDLPPMTHWSGTIIDYSFGRNIYPNGVYIGLATLSDHLPVIVDWVIRSPTEQKKALQVFGSDHSIKKMLTCSLIFVGCSLVVWLRARRR